MTFRDELIEAGARAMQYDEWQEDVPWEYAPSQRYWIEQATAALDAMLAHRTTDECPTCQGGGRIPTGELGDTVTSAECPDCTDGRVPRDTPRLAVVERADDVWDKFKSHGQPALRALWYVAPDLPAEES